MLQDPVIKEFLHRLEGVGVGSLPELDPSSERFKVVTTAGIVGFPAKKFRWHGVVWSNSYRLQAGDYVETKLMVVVK